MLEKIQTLNPHTLYMTTFPLKRGIYSCLNSIEEGTVSIVYSIHAVSCCQVSMYKFMFSQILHSVCNVDTHL